MLYFCCWSLKSYSSSKHIDIPVCFLQEQFDNGILLPKYDKSSVMPADMCTKPCSGPIISRSTKWMTGFRFYPTSETERYQFMILHEFIVKLINFQDNISYDFERQPEYKWRIIDETKMSSKILHKYSRVNIFIVQLTRAACDR